MYRLELKDLLEKYDNASNNIKALVAKAKEEETDWMKARIIFCDMCDRNEISDDFYSKLIKNLKKMWIQLK